MSGWGNDNSGWGGGSAATTADSGWGAAPATTGDSWGAATGGNASGHEWNTGGDTNAGEWNNNGAGPASGGDSFGMENIDIGADNGNDGAGGDRACFNCGEPG